LVTLFRSDVAGGLVVTGAVVGVLIPGRALPSRRDPAVRGEHAGAPIPIHIVLPLLAAAFVVGKRF
jgi:hypothetical protein